MHFMKVDVQVRLPFLVLRAPGLCLRLGPGDPLPIEIKPIVIGSATRPSRRCARHAAGSRPALLRGR